MSRHAHGWRHWQRACPRCRQRRQSVWTAAATALIMGSLLALTFTGASGNGALPTVSHPVTVTGPAQATRPVGTPGSLNRPAGTATRLVASETIALTAHQLHLLHVAHLAALARRVTVSGSSSLNGRLLATAETMRGVPYVFGGAAPGGFDCSGLIFWAAHRIGIGSMPRDTFGMLAAVGSVLIPVPRPSPGDLAFFGSGHVELYVSPGRFFGAQQTGTLVGFHDYGGFYTPTGYYAVR